MSAFRLALCNEVLGDVPFARQCEIAASLGYDALELAPFTLGDKPHLLPASRRAELRRAASDAGIVISGLHWLLLKPDGLSITALDSEVRVRTQEVIERLIGLCADLGGTRLVHGSPAQRRLPEGDEEAARHRATDLLAEAARAAERAGVVYCIEPLAPPDANFVTTIAEAVRLARRIDNPAFRTMIDMSAAGNAESEPPEALIARWMPSGLLAHVHFNDPNRRGPGQGAMRFGPILAALRAQDYDGWIGVEPFEYVPDGMGAAARAIGYIRGLMEGFN
jgi:D-psicose/D-tagatose/L-ribulose 3-epimerase